MKLNNFIITNEGYNVVNSAIINAKDITFKKIEVGDGVWNNSDIPDATELIHTVQESLISDVRVMDDKTVQCVANISNKDLSDNYTVREIGVFVEVDGDDVLYSIATAKEEFQMYIEHEVGAMQIDFRFYQKISTGNITILQSNDSYVLKETLEKSIYLENDIEEAVEEKTGFLRKFISNAWEKVYAYSHAKVCEYKKDANGNVTTVAEELDQLNSALLNKQSYPDYSKISTIISGGVGTKTYTCTENGFVQFVGASGNNSVKPEIDLSINGVYVFKYRTGYQMTYVKATSGLFPVKQGDVIKCVIQSSFVNDESVRFYQLRY